MAGQQRTIGEAAQFVIDELRNRGVTVSPSCRLGRYAAQFAKNAYARPMGANDQSSLLEGLMAMRDVEEIAMILDEFPTATKEELRRLIDDAILPRIDHSTPGRDRQLELFIGAICRRGGMAVLMDREPDLWCEASRVWLGLAVKRVRSTAKFEANLTDGAEQIQRSQLAYGLVCLDVSLGWNPNIETVLTKRTPSEVAFDYRERIFRLLDERNSVLADAWARFPKVLGLLCIDLTFTHHEPIGWFRDQCSIFSMSHRNDRLRGRVAGAFRSGWISGSPNCVDMDRVPRTGRFVSPPVDKIMPLRPGS